MLLSKFCSTESECWSTCNQIINFCSLISRYILRNAKFEGNKFIKYNQKMFINSHVILRFEFIRSFSIWNFFFVFIQDVDQGALSCSKHTCYSSWSCQINVEEIVIQLFYQVKTEALYAKCIWMYTLRIVHCVCWN